MKIGILNVQHIDNYGAVLMTYALQQKLMKMGHDAVSINFQPIDNVTLKSRIRKIKNTILKILMGGSNNKNIRADRFKSFREKYLIQTKKYSFRTIRKAKDFDCFIVGSDVVWKPARILSKESYVYFLKFVSNNAKKITYAPSIGTNNPELLNKIKNYIIDNTSNLDVLSCREGETSKWLSEITGRDVFHAIDPTLLLDKDDYDLLLEDNEQAYSRYIYFYLLGDNESAYNYVNELSRINGLPIISFCANKERINNLLEDSRQDGPIEFLKRIKNADYIVTDSFHGMVFSLIFNKEFWCFGREDISLRLVDMLSKIGLKDRFLENEVKKIIDYQNIKIDYSRVNALIKEWKEESTNYLISGGGKNIDFISENACCGCMACVSACPIGCIKIKYNNEGFKHPMIEKEKCVKCGACKNVCPIVNYKKQPAFSLTESQY